jgi:hypothetical protein
MLHDGEAMRDQLGILQDLIGVGAFVVVIGIQPASPLVVRQSAMNPGRSAGHVYAPIWAHTWATHTSGTSRDAVTRQEYPVVGAWCHPGASPVPPSVAVKLRPAPESWRRTRLRA